MTTAEEMIQFYLDLMAGKIEPEPTMEDKRRALDWLMNHGYGTAQPKIDITAEKK